MTDLPPSESVESSRDAAEVLRALLFVLTEDNFPFYNRHPHHTTAHTISMWAEKDVLSVIDNTIADLEARRPTETPREAAS